MNQHPTALDLSREQRGILVFRWHDVAESLEVPEIFGQRKRDSGPTLGITGVGDCVGFTFGQPNDTRVLDAPIFLRKEIGVAPCRERV